MHSIHSILNVLRPPLALLIGSMVFVQSLPLFAIEEDTVYDAAKPWSAATGLQLRSSVANPDEADYSLALKGSFAVGYKFSDADGVALALRGTKQLNQDQLWLFDQAAIGYTRSHQFSDKGTISAGITYDFPVNKVALRYEDSKGALSGNSSVSYLFERDEHRLQLKAGIALARYFYKYSHAAGGDILVRNSFTQSLGTSYSFRHAWTLSLSFADSSSHDFNGDRFDSKYSHVETLSYAWNPKLSIAAGHTNDGNTFDYGGAANNIQVYDKYTSQIFLGCSYVIY